MVLSGFGVSVLKASGFRAFWPRTLLVEGFRRDRVWGLPMQFLGCLGRGEGGGL